MATRRSRTYGEFDAASLRQALAGPGMDPRQWCSLGVVDVDEGSQRAVRYDQPDYGTLVHVVLQPSGIPVVCRVASACAGTGEADVEPFAAGDEVVVLVPEGDERSGCVIVGRLNNTLSPAPGMICGTEIQNNASGKRRLGPYFIESNTSIIFRVAKTNSFIALGQDGNVTATSGDASLMHVGADFIGFQSGDATMTFQANQNTKEWRLESNQSAHITTMRVGGSSPGLQTTENFFIGTNGQGPWQHLVTFEQMVSFLLAVFGVMPIPVSGAVSGPPPVFPIPSPFVLAALKTAGVPLIGYTGISALLGPAISSNAQQNATTGLTGLATGILAS
jgi:hypothetical protein